MKLKDLISRIDKSPSNESYVDIDTVMYGLGLPDFGYLENQKLKSYYFANHLCTDTVVGARAYFLSDEFVGISYQRARKSPEEFTWANAEAETAVKDYIESLRLDEFIPAGEYLDMEQDAGEGYVIEYGAQLIGNKVLKLSTGEIVEVTKKWTDYCDIDKWGSITVKYNSGKIEMISLEKVLVPFNLVGGQ